MSNRRIKSPFEPGDLEIGMPSPRTRLDEPGLAQQQQRNMTSAPCINVHTTVKLPVHLLDDFVARNGKCAVVQRFHRHCAVCESLCQGDAGPVNQIVALAREARVWLLPDHKCQVGRSCVRALITFVGERDRGAWLPSWLDVNLEDLLIHARASPIGVQALACHLQALRATQIQFLQRTQQLCLHRSPLHRPFAHPCMLPHAAKPAAKVAEHTLQSAAHSHATHVHAAAAKGLKRVRSSEELLENL